MRILQLFTWCLLFSSLSAAATAADTTTDRKPNILILMTDDWNPAALGVLGHPDVKTPILDELAARGTILNRLYCLGSNSGAVCRPSRNMFLSGKSYFRWQGPDAPADGPNLPATFKTAGYETWHSGKRGNSAAPIQSLFEHNSYLQEDIERKSGRPGRELTDQAITFLKHRDKQRPFLMYCGFEAPHDPRAPTDEDRKLYAARESELQLPPNFMPQHPFNNGELTIRDEKLIPWPRTAAGLRRELVEYYGVMTGLDREFGRIFAQLRELGELDRTIIVFTSDHGLAMGGHGLLGKQNLYEHSMRSPGIIAGPGIPKGSSNALFYLLDIYPTLCGLSGIKAPEEIDGQDYARLLRGEEQTGRPHLLTTYRNVQRAVRDDRYKLIRYPQINKTVLYDLQADPAELKDLADDPAHAATRKRLELAMMTMQQRLGDESPLQVHKPQSPEWTPPADAPAGKKAGYDKKSDAR